MWVVTADRSRRAVSPHIVQFSYVPRNEIRVNEDAIPTPDLWDDPDPTFSGPSIARKTALGLDEGHVLILEFADSWTGKDAKPG